MSWNLKSLEESLLIGSTLVEGSTLSEAEARQVLQGKTVQGHPLSEVRELLNYQMSTAWLIRELEQSSYLSVDLILGYHLRLFQGFPGQSGQWKTNANYTYLSDGTRYDYISPHRVEQSVLEWVESFNHGDPNPTEEKAAQLYYGFEEIHPFEDGNGRIGRILLSYWIHWKFRKSWKFLLADQTQHLKALEAANQNDFKPLSQFFKERIR